MPTHAAPNPPRTRPHTRPQRIGMAGRNVAAAAEAAAMIAVATVAIRLAPFRHVMASAARPGPATPRPDGAATARRLRWAVDRVADAVPWRAVCFQRGLALHWMLRRRGIPSFLHYGIDGQAAQGISAHVWVMLDGEPLIGGADAARHACVMVRPDPTSC